MIPFTAFAFGVGVWLLLRLKKLKGGASLRSLGR